MEELDDGMLFSSNLAVLNNGYPTQDINIQRGLNQGDPLAPFLFLLVTEGLSGLISKVVRLTLLSGVRIGFSNLEVSHLQYANDTIILANDTIDNLLTIKAILLGFDFASCLCVNFSKSSLIGVNYDQSFLDLAYKFIHCNQESLPFKYLGNPVGANPLLLSTWEPLINLISSRLLSWKRRWQIPFLFVYQEALFSDLEYVISGLTPPLESDVWRWRDSCDGDCSVSSTYFSFLSLDVLGS
ncbi:uncharacterized protein LOC131623294 [Vicia villosa]|uniref:uncharacterized protein LOC131623294 n=1 Tax=Vicia villosa TaxID=3911 RepID=UPI00273C2E78|nr:uncharacterized protein LOC131623294 [Vicia villosa]